MDEMELRIRIFEVLIRDGGYRDPERAALRAVELARILAKKALEE